MAHLKNLLQEKIEEYKKLHALNSSTIRMHKIHGIAHATIYKILKDAEYVPSRATIIKLLDGFCVDYEKRYNRIVLATHFDTTPPPAEAKTRGL
jgi:hypothetical protein